MLHACVQAMLGDKLVARGESSPVNGEAVLDVDLRNSPGSYVLQFSVISLPSVNTSLPVEVQGCGPGEVSVAGMARQFVGQSAGPRRKQAAGQARSGLCHTACSKHWPPLPNAHRC